MNLHKQRLNLKLMIVVLFLFADRLNATIALLGARMGEVIQTTGAGRVHTISIIARNSGEKWITPATEARITILGSRFRTIEPAVIRNLGPGERIQIDAKILTTLLPGTTAPALVLAYARGSRPSSLRVDIAAGPYDYQPDPQSLARHKSPAWFENAKLGIFINWGIYSVPAWAPSGYEYAEWYWHALNRPGSPTREYHLRTHGMEFSYDDFLFSFTGARFDPRDWIDLVRQSHARYLVIDAKHHDGFALYDTATTGRNSVALGLRRDAVGELFEAARTRAPELKLGIYYSLYEWFHPAYSGKLPENPYTGSMLRYTGSWPIADYVGDHVLPQMRELIDRYNPDLFWCDGSWEKDAAYWRTGAVIAHFFSQSQQRGKDVAVNNRCRVADPYESPLGADFLTPEYAVYPEIVEKKWESSRGLDPYSYGYNRATADADYMTANELIDSLADIVSKNGNLLLNIGPAAAGAVPEIMRRRLRELGAWLDVNGEAIFDTTYWPRGAQEGSLRFTVKPNEAFYILALEWPGELLTVASPVPIDDSHAIRLLGYDRDLRWRREDGRLVVSVPPEARAASEHAWAFKIVWGSR